MGNKSLLSSSKRRPCYGHPLRPSSSGRCARKNRFVCHLVISFWVLALMLLGPSLLVNVVVGAYWLGFDVSMTVDIADKKVGRRTFLRILVFASLAFIFVAALAMAAATGSPPLPPVQVAASTHIEGDLLGHVDGFWYVFDEQGTLVSIPDKDVTEVRIVEGE